MAIESVLCICVDAGLFLFVSCSHVVWMFDICYIYHDFAGAVSICRRVFDFTVSSVSDVSSLYFSRSKR